MNSVRLLRTSPGLLEFHAPRDTARRLHTSSLLSKDFHSGKTVTKGGQDTSISQGHVVSPNNRSPQDVQSQAARAGMDARKAGSSYDHPLDAASSATTKQHKPRGMGGGNPEGIGFVEQVGGEGFSADLFGSQAGVVGRSSSDGAGDGLPGRVEVMPATEADTGRGPIPWEGQTQSEKGRGPNGSFSVTGARGTGPSTPNPLPSQWEGKRTYATSPSAASGSGRTDPHFAGKTQKRKEIHQSSVSTPSESPRISPRASSRTPGHDVNANATSPSGDYLDSGEPGAGSKEYGTVSRDDPYDLPEADRDHKLRYGGRIWDLREWQELIEEKRQ
ncbi:hypothetical protein JAAARDRAFT_27579 [Jaapia argillacea MUCL 33604]|uniref:Uncharacterized protein n=1 Tax=Jaapia argillacea MUCL 33604 TaxID=933084 RepID=A0A067QK73_9AGAM|nr:hypothetical protein JAAARDRAFT_27579 [Jaapia argillacea MUCL 33604]